mgnify:CR=1 FL=1
MCVTVILVILIISIIRFSFCDHRFVYGNPKISSRFSRDELWVDDVVMTRAETGTEG